MPFRRPGFTLIEILVAVTVIGLLLALLLPAVQSSREAARRAACQNGLRQVTAAVLLHESANRALPRIYNGSFLPQPRSPIDEFHFHAWRSAVLPQLEQQNLFASLNLALPATTSSNQTAVNVPVAVFLCPSTSNYNPTVRGVMEWNDGKIPVNVIGTAARSDYELIGGVQVLPQTRSSADLGVLRFGAWGEPTYDLTTGMSLKYRTARLADVTDGLSNTLLVAERAGRPDLYRRGEKPDPYPYRVPGSGVDHHQAAWGISTHFWWTVSHLKTSVNETNGTGIYSFHPGGANAALADGSVRFLKESTSPSVLAAMVTRSGAEIVGPE